MDNKLLFELQENFPLASQPYQIIGERLALTEAAVITRIEALKKSRVIRRIGGIFDSRKLGYVSTLVAQKVAPEKIAAAAELINSYAGVTHNYWREHEFNLWFTLIAEKQTILDEQLAEIKTKVNPAEQLVLPALKIFKIKTGFSVFAPPPDPLPASSRRGGDSISPPARYKFLPVDKTIIRLVQEDLPLTPNVFAELAARAGVTAAEFLAKLNYYKNEGIMRRFAAVLYHRQAGFTVNSLVVWHVAPEQVERIGTRLAGFGEISHCYERPVFPTWPYNLYTMIHNRSEEGFQKSLAEMVAATGMTEYVRLKSLQEFKKVSMRYF